VKDGGGRGPFSQAVTKLATTLSTTGSFCFTGISVACTSLKIDSATTILKEAAISAAMCLGAATQPTNFSTVMYALELTRGDFSRENTRLICISKTQKYETKSKLVRGIKEHQCAITYIQCMLSIIQSSSIQTNTKIYLLYI
jgi:hypothetical protein